MLFSARRFTLSFPANRTLVVEAHYVNNNQIKVHKPIAPISRYHVFAESEVEFLFWRVCADEHAHTPTYHDFTKPASQS